MKKILLSKPFELTLLLALSLGSFAIVDAMLKEAGFQPVVFMAGGAMTIGLLQLANWCEEVRQLLGAKLLPSEKAQGKPDYDQRKDPEANPATGLAE